MAQVLHVGTVIEGSAEYKSSRMTNKDRKQSIVEEIISDSQLSNYSKRKYASIQADHASHKKSHKKGKAAKHEKKKQKHKKSYF